MKNSFSSNQNNTESNHKFLWFLMLTYSMFNILANWYYPQFLIIFSLSINAGILIFTPSFLCLAIIAEVYGYKHSRCAVWLGLSLNLILILYGQLVTHLPSPAYAINNPTFDVILAPPLKIIIAGLISYLISSFFTPYLMAKMKIIMQGRYIGIRLLLSSGIPMIIYYIIFFSIAFPLREFGPKDISLFLGNNIIYFLAMPTAILLINYLKKVEKSNIYDYKTKFSIFSFETQYKIQDNKL